MKSGFIQLLDLDFGFKIWKNRLHCYLSELDILTDRILVLQKEISNYKPEGTLQEAMAAQRMQIKALLNRIELLEQEMSLFAEDYPIDTNHNHYKAYETFETEVEKIGSDQKRIFASNYPELNIIRPKT